jgi:putative DNA primase/helicase
MNVESAFAKISDADIIALPTAQLPEVETEIVVAPVPVSAVSIEQAATTLGRSAPDSLWKYHDGNRKLLFAVGRWNGSTGKKAKVLPISWIRDASGAERFAFKHQPSPRPLYGLPELHERPHASVVVVEGEKCVEAAKAVFRSSVVVTSPGGSNGALQADWTSLAGRSRALIWPDLDAPGIKYATTVANILVDLGIPEILIVDAQRLAEVEPSGNRRETTSGWDVADAIAEGHEPGKLRAAAVEAAQPHKPGPRFLSFGSFTMSNEGLVLAKEGKGEDAITENLWVCSAFEIIGRARDPNGREWARWLRWTDDDKREHLHPVKDADLHGDPRSLCAALATRGLRISTSYRAHLLDYLNRARVDRRITIVPRTGWHDVGGTSVFILPGETIGTAGRETVVLDSNGASPYESRGTLQEWKNSVGALTRGQRLPILAISTAFAGPLLHIAGLDGGGINLFGSSSKGKTTCAECAASLFGKGSSPGYVRPWRATANALEAAAAMFSDTVMILDELGVVEAREAATAIYQLASGTGKGRSARDGSLRSSLTWRVLVLSTGEMPMAAKINEDRNGRRAQAGQAVRLLDVPADAGKGFGAFDHAGPDNDAARLSDALKRAARTTYGTAGPAFIKRLAAENSKEAARHITAAVEAFVDSHATAGSDGQVRRAAQRLGLIGTAGEMAAGWGIVPWAPGEAFAAAEAALASWVEGRGGTEGAEVREAISRVRLFIETHGDSRFEPVDKSDDFRPVTNRAGWRKGSGSERVWLVPAETWKTEICSGLDPGLAARVLADRGMLVRGDDGFLRVHRIEGRSQRAYTITAEIMGGDA